MPIRMVDDPNDQRDNTGNDSGGGGRGSGGSGGGLLQLLPLVIGLLIRKPILLLVVLGAGAVYYFYGGCNQTSISQQAEQFTTGGVLDPKEFDKANVYEGLDPSKTDLPEAVSLLKFAPDRKNKQHLHQAQPITKLVSLSANQ